MFTTNFTYPIDLLNNLSWQMLATHVSPRSSRGSTSTRGSPMGIMKPSTTVNNSPRPVRHRRTTVNGTTQSRMAPRVVDYTQLPAAFAPTAGRPMSWHPGSFSQTMQYPQQQQQQQQQQVYPQWQPYQDTYLSYSPSTTSYSCNGSPSSYSPMPLPSTGFEQSSYFNFGSWPMTQQPMPNYLSTPSETFSEPFPMVLSNYNNTPLLDDWTLFTMPNMAPQSPLKPEILPQQQPPKQQQQQQPQLSLLSGGDDDGGEILVGMGLYDESDKLIDDPQSDCSPSSMSMLMGSMPTGKGLKLEETWQPPESEDEEGDEE